MGAAVQGYDLIELDPAVTADGCFVVLHDRAVNRTGRSADGRCLPREQKISDMTYGEAAKLDFGVSFSLKFKGERIPRMEEVLAFAVKADITLKMDSKIWQFTPAQLTEFFALLRNSGAKIALTCNSIETAQQAVCALPEAQLHYDGAVSEEILQRLSRLTGALTVWLPFACKATSWVTVPTATAELCALIRKYARLGIWIVSEYTDFETIVRDFQPDVVETTGAIKPVRRINMRTDMHTHSEHSHDSVCPVSDMAEQELHRGIAAFAVTDHSDILYCQRFDLAAIARNSVAAARTENQKRDGTLRVLSGVEIGEGLWYTGTVEQVLRQADYDVVLGSVHTIRYRPYDTPFAGLDFTHISDADIDGMMHRYFEELLETLQTIPCDVMTHLTIPLRYINGNFHRNVDPKKYEPQIREILQYIIRHGIAMEINTSGIGTSYDEFLPPEWVVRLYRELGGYLVTVGSDAHVAANAAKGMDEAIALLKRCGFRNVFYYEKRHAMQCALM